VRAQIRSNFRRRSWGTHLRCASVCADGDIHFRLKQSTPQAENADEIVRLLVEAARESERQSQAAGTRIASVSLVVPGTVNVEEGFVVKSTECSLP